MLTKLLLNTCSHFANVFGHCVEEAGPDEGKLNGAGEEVGVDIGQGLVSQDGRVKSITGGRTVPIVVTPITCALIRGGNNHDLMFCFKNSYLIYLLKGIILMLCIHMQRFVAIRCMQPNLG